MPINIPRNFSAILNGDSDIQGNVAHLCSNIQDLFKLNPDFFPDYTFHGIDHINEVLDHADHLIPGKTRDMLTSRDIAFLVSAIVIHDVGMFLAEDGVRRLIFGDLRQQQLDGFEDDTWENAWEDYTDRVKRYTQEKMLHLFGSNITVDPDCVKKEFIDNDNDRRVIGEFLRQEHPRLAHEIAVNSFPGDKNTDVFANTSFDETDRDMIGLLARSHGMAIRDTEDYCENNYEEGSKPCNIPIFYLMAVLRIADLLDAGSHRAPKIRLDTKKIRIPISVEEWTWNQRITPKKCKWDMQKGKRHIYAEPTTSIEYVQLDRWLSQLQAELDLSWSVLSEKYPTEDYRLSIHRVTSNIREAGTQKRMNDIFLTKEAKVTANPEIVKLMMEPLYGDDPSYGVRELLQNAVDACIEREDKEGSGYKGKVTIRVDEKYFVIEDNGIGMNENVLLNYYLSAGSSYRNSDEWKRDFTENGESKIARSGRFGVGFLAAFLLGDEISVHTQHMNDRKGYVFSFNQESRPLNIRREKRPEGAGTTITIRLKDGVYKKLKQSAPNSRARWYSFYDEDIGEDKDHAKDVYQPKVRWTDWYVYDDPAVEYYLDSARVSSENTLFSRSMEAQRDWISLPNTDFQSYYWRPTRLWDGDFCCNGIRIPKVPPIASDGFGLSLSSPDVLLTDRNGHLKLNLARSQVEQLPSRKELAEQFVRFHIARLLMTPWNTPEACAHHFEEGFSGFRSDITDRCIYYLLSSKGFTLLNPALYRALREPPLFLLYCADGDALASLGSAVSDIPGNVVFSITTKHSNHSYSLWEEQNSPSSFLKNISYNHHMTSGWNLYFRSYYVQETLLPTLSEQALSRLDYPKGITQNGIYRSNPNAEGLPFDPKAFDFQTFPVVVRRGVQYDGPPSQNAQLFHRTLCQLLDCPADDFWIPFDMEERKKKFPKAFRELKDYMDYIEANQYIPDFSRKDPPSRDTSGYSSFEIFDDIEDDEDIWDISDILDDED